MGDFCKEIDSKTLKSYETLTQMYLGLGVGRGADGIVNLPTELPTSGVNASIFVNAPKVACFQKMIAGNPELASAISGKHDKDNNETGVMEIITYLMGAGNADDAGQITAADFAKAVKAGALTQEDATSWARVIMIYESLINYVTTEEAKVVVTAPVPPTPTAPAPVAKGDAPALLTAAPIAEASKLGIPEKTSDGEQSWWASRSTLEKGLIITLGAAVAGLGIFFAVRGRNARVERRAEAARRAEGERPAGEGGGEAPPPPPGGGGAAGARVVAQRGVVERGRVERPAEGEAPAADPAAAPKMSIQAIVARIRKVTAQIETKAAEVGQAKAELEALPKGRKKAEIEARKAKSDEVARLENEKAGLEAVKAELEAQKAGLKKK